MKKKELKLIHRKLKEIYYDVPGFEPFYQNYIDNIIGLPFDYEKDSLWYYDKKGERNYYGLDPKNKEITSVGVKYM